MDKKEILAHTIDCEERQMSFFDKETIEPLCKVQILENTATGDISWGWQRRSPEEIWDLAWKIFDYNFLLDCDKDELEEIKKEFIEELMKDEL